MTEDLKKLEGEKWRDNELFEGFVRSLDDLNENEQKIQIHKITLLLKLMQESMDKHFSIWHEDNLFFYSLYSEQPMATVIAKKITGNKRSVNDETYYSTFHKRDFHLPTLSSFIDDRVTEDVLQITREVEEIKENMIIVSMIANGADIWSDGNDELVFFKECYLRKYSSLPTNTIFVERGVKESGYVTLGRRDESTRSLLILARGKVIPEALEIGSMEVNVGNDGDKKRCQGKRKVNNLIKEVNRDIQKLNVL